MKYFANVLKEKVYYGNTDLEKSAEVLNVAFGIDANFAIGMGVLMNSMLEHNTKSLVFHIITDSLQAKDLARLETLIKDKNVLVIIYYINDDVFAKLPTAFTWSKATYYRFLVDEFITYPARVLYIDVDMLCLADFSDLYTRDMGDKVAMVVSDGSEMRDLFKGRYNYLGDDYFNAGMLLINLANWRREKIAQQCVELLLKQELKYLDQDALNAISYNKVLFIEKKYNNLMHMTDLEDEYPENTVFLHLSGSVKPWHRWGERHGLTKLWLKYRDASPWHDEPIIEATTYKQAKFMARMYGQYGEIGNMFKWKLRYGLWKVLRGK